MKQTEYDVIIAGAGLGGLFSGALLVRRGYKVLVVESRDRVGGRVSTREVEGFKLPTGAIILHRGGVIDEIFNKIGVKAEFTPVPQMFYRIQGKNYELPSGGGIRTLLGILENLEVEKTKLVGRLVKEVATEKVVNAFRGVKSEQGIPGGMKFREWLLQYTENELVHHVFDIICVANNVARAHELPAAEFFGFLANTGGIRQMNIATRGNLPIMEAVAAVIKTNGDVWTNCPAKQIVVKGKEATGVVIQKDGTDVEISSKVVISNAGPRKTTELAGSENFGEDYLRTMRVKLRPAPIVLILVASDIPLMQGAGPMLITGARRVQSAIPLSSICPGLAPAGQHLLYSCASPLDSLHHMEIEDEIEKCTQDLKEIFPEFERHGRILKMEPLDIDDDFPAAHSWPGYTMPRETPVANLYNVGDGVLSSGWSATSGVAECAKQVVELVRKRISPG